MLIYRNYLTHTLKLKIMSTVQPSFTGKYSSTKIYVQQNIFMCSILQSNKYENINYYNTRLLAIYKIK